MAVRTQENLKRTIHDLAVSRERELDVQAEYCDMNTELEVTIAEVGIMLAKLDDGLPSSCDAAAKQRAPTAEGATQALTSAERASPTGKHDLCARRWPRRFCGSWGVGLGRHVGGVSWGGVRWTRAHLRVSVLQKTKKRMKMKRRSIKWRSSSRRRGILPGAHKRSAKRALFKRLKLRERK